jgi:aspartate kinase
MRLSLVESLFGRFTDEIQVWKDVDGILTTDPNVVSDAKTVPVITYEEASELAQFGAQVLHPIAMQPAKTYNIPVRVKNSYNPSAVGSRIQLAKEDKDESLVTAITFKRDVAVLDLHSTEMVGTFGFLSYIFQAFERHQLSVDVSAKW